VEKVVQNLNVVALWISGKAIPYQIVISQVYLIHVIRKLPESESVVFIAVLHLIDFDVHAMRGEPAALPISPFRLMVWAVSPVTCTDQIEDACFLGQDTRAV
jgi:hypothetical protein